MQNFRRNGQGTDWTTLPGNFKRNGYFTTGTGKTFHPGDPYQFDYPYSWSYDIPYGFGRNCTGAAGKKACEGHGSMWPGTWTDQLRCDNKSVSCGNGIAEGPEWARVEGDCGYWCSLDMDKLNEPLWDQVEAANGVERLRYAAKKQREAAKVNEHKPFFLAVGFHRPHLPWIAPKEFYALYPAREQHTYDKGPLHPKVPVGMPGVAWHGGGPSRNAIGKPCSHNATMMARRGLYATMSYVDSLVGQVLDELDTLGLAKNTAVAFVGDHGQNVGEHNLWEKMTNFETSVRVPFIVRAPWIAGSAGRRSAAMVELVDLYKTLSELGGIPLPTDNHGPTGGLAPVQGKSVVPAMKGQEQKLTAGFPYAFSQFAKSGKSVETAFGTCMSCYPKKGVAHCQQPCGSAANYMGFSVRSADWRYTQWLVWNGTSGEPIWGATPAASELYDHRNDSGSSFDNDGENVNLAGSKDASAVAAINLLGGVLRNHFQNDRISSAADRPIKTTDDSAAATSSVVPNMFKITIVDGVTGRGVPLVQLRTSNYISWYSDSAGVVAFDEPGMLGMAVYFVVLTDGYEIVASAVLPNTPGSEPGVLLRTVGGDSATITLRRTQPAERLYRLTGGGLYRDTLLTGGAAPVKEPQISKSSSIGQDSLMAIPFKKQVFWCFGDTECPAGPRDTDCQHYGRFTNCAVTVRSVGNGSVPPSLDYFVSKNSRAPGGLGSDGRPNDALLKLWNPGSFVHPKAMLAGPQGQIYNQSSWIGSMTVTKDAAGNDDALWVTYVCPWGGPDKIFGVAKWSEAQQVFLPEQGAAQKLRYSGAQVVQTLSPADKAAGFIYYASAFAMSRVPANSSSIVNPSLYEYFSPCSAGASGCKSKMSAASWGWKKSNLDGGLSGVGYFNPTAELGAIKAGLLPRAAARMQVHDKAHPFGGSLVLSRGSVNWNAHRSKYVLIAEQAQLNRAAPLGASRHGEIFYCESSSITGPWTACTSVITHNQTGMSCYNPMQLAWLDEYGGARVYIACTFTAMASSTGGKTDRSCRADDYGGVDCAVAVPRYEYNNLVFGLDVDAVAVAGRGQLPVAPATVGVGR